MLRRSRKVKILATLGPASADRGTILALHQAGADTFRINMSHASHDKLHELVGLIRSVEAECARPIGILADLQGPKLRIGAFESGPIVLKGGCLFQLHRNIVPGDISGVYLPHPEILDALQPGHRVLLDDGKLRLRVLDSDGLIATTTVEIGGQLSGHKGVSLPDTLLASGALTSKDRADVEAATKAGVDWIAMSFVQGPEDVKAIRLLVGDRCGIISKIEKPQAVVRFREILQQSDAIMVARGDLGVEMPLEKVPGVQKEIIGLAREAGKPVIVATQLLESMIQAAVPTRAEVSDVANAVFEGADVIMLSAESAVGAYPVEAVQTMNRIAEEIERNPNFSGGTGGGVQVETGPEALSASARQVAQTINAAAIACATNSGLTALRTARERPQTPILVLTPRRSVGRRLTLVWGIHAIIGEAAHSMTELVQRCGDMARQEGFAVAGDSIVVVAGIPFGAGSTTNVLRIARVEN